MENRVSDAETASIDRSLCSEPSLLCDGTSLSTQLEAVWGHRASMVVNPDTSRGGSEGGRGICRVGPSILPGHRGGWKSPGGGGAADALLMTRVFEYDIVMHASDPPASPATPSSPRQPTTVGHRGLPKKSALDVRVDGVRKCLLKYGEKNLLRTT